MTRAEELAAIEHYIARHGVRRIELSEIEFDRTTIDIFTRARKRGSVKGARKLPGRRNNDAVS